MYFKKIKMKSIIKPLFIAALVTGVLSGCANDDSYDNPQTTCITESPTKTVAEIYATAPASSAAIGAFQHYENDDIIEAYVTSNDAGSSFYKSISFQTLDGSLAFSIPVDMYNIYTEFEPGRKVFVHMKGRDYNQTYGSLLIGQLYTNDIGQVSIGRLVPEEFRRTVKASCVAVDEDQLVQKLTITQALTDANINKLIEFDNVQFGRASQGKTLYDASNQIGGATNHLLTDASGNSIIFRTSEFAKFAGNMVPSGSGKVRGVLTKYRGDYQFLARTAADIMLNEPAFFINTQLGGTAITYNGSFTENFESYSSAGTGDRVFPKYLNDSYIGTRFWEVKTFGGNKYIQMSAFGGSGQSTAMFYVPVDFTAANTLSFKTKDGFNNGMPLKVYYVTGYTPGTELDRSRLVDITSMFTLASDGPGSGYATSFTNSGNYSIPADVTGNGFFIFEYSGGSGGITTNYQIDDIVIN